MSEARKLADSIRSAEDSFPFIAMPAPSSVSGTEYKIGYFNDKSILMWIKGTGVIVFDEAKTYYRDTIEHLARCLSLFTKEKRAEMVGGQDKWIDGIHWAADGSFLEV
jgi:hypothetical protein